MNRFKQNFTDILHENHGYHICQFLAHHSQRFKWAFTITWSLASDICQLFTFWSQEQTKLEHDTPWMILFQKFVQWPCPTSKMASMASDWWKNWNLWKSSSSKPLDGMKPNLAQILLEWSHQLSKMVAMADYVTFGIWP